MTTRELIGREAQNTDRIHLELEGIFWKAYERSAYAVCTQARPFKPTKKALKVLSGDAIVSIGFPMAIEEKVFEGFTLLSAEAKQRVYAAKRPVAEADFREWKDAIPLTVNPVPDPVPAPVVTLTAGPVPTDAAAPAAAGPDGPEREVLARLGRFDLATASPMDCLLLVAELKRLLSPGV